MSDLTTRAARLDDLDDLMAIEQACFTSDRISRRAMRAWLRREHGLMFLACDGERVAGYVLVIHHDGRRTARMYSLAIDPAYRGRGLARRLIEAGERAAARRGCAELRLEVAPTNASARALYDAMGYEVFGTYEDFYEDRGDALRMRKALRAAQAATPARRRE